MKTVDLAPLLDLPFDDIAYIDWETYYAKDFTLSKMTTEAYIRDPRFEEIGIGVQLGDREPMWLEREDFADWAAGIDWSRTAFSAHHTHFDGLIAAHHHGIYPAFYFDTLSMARVLHGTDVGGSLGKLMPYYGVGEKGHEVVNAFGKRRADFTPAEWAQYGVYCLNDVRGHRAILEQMIANGYPISELWLISLTVKAFAQPTLELDAARLKAYLASEQQRKAGLIRRVVSLVDPSLDLSAIAEDDLPGILAATKKVLGSGDKFAQVLFELGVEPPVKVSPSKTKTARKTDPDAEPQYTWAFAKTDPGMKDLLEHEEEEVRWLAEARVETKSTIGETRTQRFLSMAERGPACIYLKYGGAHTFRFSGGDRLNFQNLPRGGELRKSMLAPEGWELVVCDSSQIEPRVNSWLAGESALLETFRRINADPRPEKIEGPHRPEDLKEDLYSTEGTRFFGRTVTKADVERQFSKNMVIGCGYGMGYLKFGAEMARGMLGSKPKVFVRDDVDRLGCDIDEFLSNEKKCAKVMELPSRIQGDARLVHFAVADHLIQVYRDTCAAIVQLWGDMDIVVRAMDVDDPETPPEPFGPGGVLQVVRHGLVLPSGLVMRYPGLRFSEEDRGYSYVGGHGGERKKVYGGLMTENVVQALARIVMTDQVLYCERTFGYHKVTSTHDEAVFLVPEGQGEEAYNNVLSVMKTPPVWAPDLPVSAAGGWGKCYGDIK